MALLCRSQTGFDTGGTAPSLLYQAHALSGRDHRREDRWLRLRSVGDVRDSLAVVTHRRALLELQRQRYRICVLLMIGPPESKSGMRVGGGRRLPSDLRDVYEWAVDFGKIYCGLVDRWEIDNEPDISFLAENAETYAAFLKAMSLGIREGERRAVNHSTRQALFGKQWYLAGPPAYRGLQAVGARVVMASMALPPGPYFERLRANHVLSYSNGFNFHYYGYAEDFSGVYRQFQAAVEETPSGDQDGRVADNSAYLADLPVFVTEYGYGLLSSLAAVTTEGRVRQWRWIKSVSEQTRALRLEGPMAFYLPPYLEHGKQEFGLSMKNADVLQSSALREELADVHPLPTAHRPQPILHWSAGGVSFKPEDFGAVRAEPWMEGIGRKIGDHEASPALAWLLAQSAPPAPSRSWPATVLPASPIVIDFIADEGASAVKALMGYGLTGTGDFESRGSGRLRIYNFSDQQVEGRLDLGQWAKTIGADPAALTLRAGEMREFPVVLSLSSTEFRSYEWTVSFVSGSRKIGKTVFSTLLYPDARPMSRRELARLAGVEGGIGNARVLDARPLATEEPPETSSGRWRVTQGLSVSEKDGVWSFSVTGYPAEPLHSAIAELVLPDNFSLPENSLFECEYRLVARGEFGLANRDQPRVPMAAAVMGQEAMGIYWRTANGNLYTVWQTPPATTMWRRYSQAKASYTMGFFGRANLPWRFADNKPVAVVFRFQPNVLPATYEVRNAVVTKYSR